MDTRSGRSMMRILPGTCPRGQCDGRSRIVAQRARLMTSELDQLATQAGVIGEFVDARGERVVASSDVKRELLRRMGVASSTARDGSEPTEREFLPACFVTKPQQAGHIEINLPSGFTEKTTSWRVICEDGKIYEGRSTCRTCKEEGFCVLNIPQLPYGYHEIELVEFDATSHLIVTPGRCWLPAEFDEGKRWWGISLQLYLLRSRNDWGIGDFRTLVDLVPRLPRGCDVVGLNPLHQMFLDKPECASPYSPLSRRFLNVLYISVPDICEFSGSNAPALLATSAFRTGLERCRTTPWVDYTEVARLKLAALRLVYAHFLEVASNERKREFDAFKISEGEELSRTSTFQALRSNPAKVG